MIQGLPSLQQQQQAQKQELERRAVTPSQLAIQGLLQDIKVPDPSEQQSNGQGPGQLNRLLEGLTGGSGIESATTQFAADGGYVLANPSTYSASSVPVGSQSFWSAPTQWGSGGSGMSLSSGLSGGTGGAGSSAAGASSAGSGLAGAAGTAGLIAALVTGADYVNNNWLGGAEKNKELGLGENHMWWDEIGDWIDGSSDPGQAHARNAQRHKLTPDYWERKMDEEVFQKIPGDKFIPDELKSPSKAIQKFWSSIF